MGWNLALDQASGNSLMVDRSCRPESLTVLLMFHVDLSGIFERASREASGSLADPFFGWGEMEINRHSGEGMFLNCKIVHVLRVLMYNINDVQKQ